MSARSLSERKGVKVNPLGPAPRHTLGDYVDIVWRRRLILIAALALGLLAGAGFAWSSPPVYVSSSSVLVQPTGAEKSEVSSEDTKAAINLDTEAQLVTSTSVAKLASKRLDGADPHTIASRVAVSVPANTSILAISYSADTADAARDGAAAFARAYLEHRTDNARDSLARQASASQSELDGLVGERKELTEQLSDLDESGTRYAAVNQDRGLIDTEIAEVSAEAGRLKSAAESVHAGQIITDPNLPTTASSPDLPLTSLSSGLLVLLLALAGVAFAHRVSPRVWHPADLPRRCGVELMAALPRAARVHTDEVFDEAGAAGRVFTRLRNEIAAITDGPGVVVVAGVAAGPASTVVAANLAVATARGARDTVVVGTHSSQSAAPQSSLDSAGTPGLCDVLAERDELDAATHHATEHHRLRVIPPGNEPCRPAPETISALYESWRRDGCCVIIDAAPLATSSDAQLWAAEADAVLLAVECGRERIAEVADAAAAIHRVGARLLGAVAIPPVPVRKSRKEHAAVSATGPADDSDDER